MTDVFSKQKRSYVMSRIRSKNTKLDLTMRSLLEKSDIHFVLYPNLYGHPDFLIGNNILLFCDSSFWHGRNWAKLKKQLRGGNNPKYWVNHIAKNRSRDKSVTSILKKEGYKVVRFWDTDILKRPEWCIKVLTMELAQINQPTTLMP